MRQWIIGALVVGLAVGIYWYQSTSKETQDSAKRIGAAIVEINLPQAFSGQAMRGQAAFEANCAACHGEHAVGQEGVAPPLVHIIYEPNHHADESFQRAVALGVRAHHWPFGDMPSVEGLDRTAVADIIAYVRELQRANGIQ